jgi:hypothetical protein
MKRYRVGVITLVLFFLFSTAYATVQIPQEYEWGVTLTAMAEYTRTPRPTPTNAPDEDEWNLTITPVIGDPATDVPSTPTPTQGVPYPEPDNPYPAPLVVSSVQIVEFKAKPKEDLGKIGVVLVIATVSTIIIFRKKPY